MKSVCFFSAVICAFVLASPEAFSFLSPHPVQLYDKGDALIADYAVKRDALAEAQDIFIWILEKYPNSPFGYLGMSHLYRIDARLDDDRYDLTLIRERALPFALKALQLGPSIQAVHENYAFFEQFFSDDYSPRAE